MAKFIRKPIVVEATQWFQDGDHESAHLMRLTKGSYYYIQTLEGNMRVNPGDWIVTGVAGEHYPVKPHIFEKIYEPCYAEESFKKGTADVRAVYVRMVDEAHNLMITIKKLIKFMGSDAFSGLSREERDLISRQRKHMELYSYVLQKRVALYSV